MVAVRQAVTIRSVHLTSLKGNEPREGVLDACDVSFLLCRASAWRYEAHLPMCGLAVAVVFRLPRGHIVGV
jgi:hypothetical protein